MLKSPEERNIIWPEDIKVGHISYPPGGTLGPRIQSTIELVMIHQGEMNVYVDGIVHHADARTVTIFFPGHQERYLFAKDTITHHSYIHIALPTIHSSINERLHKLPCTIPLSSKMASLTDAALDYKNSSLPTNVQMLKSLAVLMLWRFIGEAERFCKEEKITTPHALVQNACKFIESHLSEEVSLAAISETVSVCPEHLIRVFKTELGKTPIAYLWERRVLLGVDLLEHSGLSVNLIAERCGFKTRNHFSKRVFEATGCSPKDVRQRIWRNSTP